MELAVKTLEGAEAGSVTLSDEIFGLEPRQDILHRMVVWQLARRQAGTHQTLSRADINRSTFYLHYKDVDSLLVAVEDYAIEYIQSHFKGPDNAFDELVGFLTYMKNTPRLRNLFFALAGERGDPRFTRRLQELTFQTFERRWLEHLPSSGLDDEKTLVYSYVQSGIVSVFYSWLTDKMPNMSAEQLVCLLQKLILHGVTGLGEDLFPFGNSRT